MTIPIIPGPFSFLQSAGEAAGAIDNVREEAKRHAQKTARDALTQLEQLVQLGILPAKTFASPETQHLAQVAGVPIGAEVAPQPKEQLNARASEIIPTLGNAEVRMATGLPAASAGQAERVKTEALTGVSGGTAQGRAVAGVPGAGEAAATESARTVGAQAQTAQAELVNEVTKGAQALFGTDDFAKKLAEEAALGILPYRLQQLTLSRAKISEDTKLVLLSVGEIGKAYREARDNWDQQMRQAALTSGIDQADNEALAKFRETYLQTVPPPTYDQVRDEYAQSMLGMNPQEFQQLARDAAHSLSVNASTKTSGSATAQPSVTQSMSLLQTSPKLAGALNLLSTSQKPEETARQFKEALDRGDFSPLEMRVVMAALRSRVSAEVFDKIKIIVNPYIGKAGNP